MDSKLTMKNIYDQNQVLIVERNNIDDEQNHDFKYFKCGFIAKNRQGKGYLKTYKMW